jgi:hypothetical protein
LVVYKKHAFSDKARSRIEKLKISPSTVMAGESLRIIARPPAIGVVISDHALAARIIEKARDLGFHAYWAVSIDELPLRARYVVLSRKDGEIDVQGRVPIYVEDYPSICCMLLSLIAAERGERGPRIVEVAIDPGKNIGLALAVDEVVIGVESHASADLLISRIDEFLRCFGRGRRTVIYVGESGGELSHELIERLKRGFKNVSILMVPEEGSREGELGAGLTRDERSALIIYQRAKSQA